MDALRLLKTSATLTTSKELVAEPIYAIKVLPDFERCAIAPAPAADGRMLEWEILNVGPISLEKHTFKSPKDAFVRFKEIRYAINRSGKLGSHVRL